MSHIRRSPVAALMLALAACTGPAADNAAAPAAAATGNALAGMAALNPAQLDMVLFRAVRDAGQDCQDVTRSERLPDQAGGGLWRVTCRGGGQFAVAIGRDGNATVTAPRPPS